MRKRRRLQRRRLRDLTRVLVALEEAAQQGRSSEPQRATRISFA
jgi:hypothetical protein